ncbi:DUF6573 family protein [Maridesulfovibrio bastinii]|uniref:DUF6573 family protein n=1 Tax=Maridesulfovibrio bastinii TaxID=47157 RepID=UPI00040325C8|nr:DUF6573 family protein [Maridesulfovibrio bastinii]
MVINCIPEVFLIHSYLRKQAIEDGYLIDVTEKAKESGFKVPVCISLNLHERYVTPPSGLEGEGQSYDGRLHDVFEICKAAVYERLDENRVIFNVFFLMKTKPRTLEDVEIVSVIGPDDDGKPCLTLMLPEDD